MSSEDIKISGNQSHTETPPSGNMVWIPGGSFMMGSNNHYEEEAPAHKVTVDGFWMDKYELTNAEFKKFVDETGYITFCEKPPNPEDYPGALPEMLVPASVVFLKPDHAVSRDNVYNWWTYIPGANWKHPFGPDSTIEGKGNFPVVQLVYEDVEAYAKWAGKEIPTEAEWEFAARGGLEEKEYAWGDEMYPDEKAMANTWQGEFPYENTLADGFELIAPVGSFPPNGYGLYDIIGNVWEWTSDWYQQHNKFKNSCCSEINPRIESKEFSFDPRTPDIVIPRKVMKGGSYLCAPSYCRRYRPAARMAQPIDTSTCHLGCRLIVRHHKK